MAYGKKKDIYMYIHTQQTDSCSYHKFLLLTPPMLSKERVSLELMLSQEFSGWRCQIILVTPFPGF